MAQIITLPQIVRPQIDRTEFRDGRVTFFVWLEGTPIWVTGVISGPMLNIEELMGWIAFEHPPQGINVKRYKGLFFFDRKDAVLCAEEKADALVKLLSRR